jgi:RNA polymerase sigma-70 factor (ECF subfamily)
VATNACLDELRRRRRRPMLGGVEPGAHGAGPGSDGAGGRGGFGGSGGLGGVDGERPAFGSPTAGEAVIDATAQRLDVDGALARIPHDFRVAVVLRDLCDLDYAEIARVLDLPPGTVRSRIARGRGLLADLLGNQATPTERPTPAP